MSVPEAEQECGPCFRCGAPGGTEGAADIAGTMTCADCYLFWRRSQMAANTFREYAMMFPFHIPKERLS